MDIESKTGRTIDLLLVEDGESDALLAEAHLQKVTGDLSFDVTWVSSLEEARQRLSEEDFDIVLLDLHLPDAKGIQAVQELCRLVAAPPIVVLTGKDDESIAQRSLQLGAQDFFPKSRLESDALSRCLRYAIERHNLLAELEKKVDEVQEKEAQLQKLVYGYPDGIIIVSFDGIVRFANSKAATLMEGSSEDMVGNPFEFELADGACKEIELADRDQQNKKVELRVTTLVWEDEPVYMAALREA